MNEAARYLIDEVPDATYGAEHLAPLQRAGALDAARTYLAVLALQGRALPGDGDPIETARLIEEREAEYLRKLRHRLATALNDSQLDHTTVVMVALGTPQGHQRPCKGRSTRCGRRSQFHELRLDRRHVRLRGRRGEGSERVFAGPR